MFRELIRSGVAGLERGEDRAGVKPKPRRGPDLGETQDSGKKCRLSSRGKGVAMQGFR